MVRVLMVVATGVLDNSRLFLNSSSDLLGRRSYWLITS
jgi:hypothetical protein